MPTTDFVFPKLNRLFLFPLEWMLLYPLTWTYEATLSLPGYRRLVGVFVEATSVIVSGILRHPAVREALTNTICEGMNQFVLQRDLDEHVKVMANTLKDLQPELARVKGEEFHNTIASFIQGVVSPRKDFNTTCSISNNKNKYTGIQSNSSAMNRSVDPKAFKTLIDSDCIATMEIQV